MTYLNLEPTPDRGPLPASQASAVRPYRLLGLILSCALILVVALALCALTGALVFAVSAIAWGVQPTLRTFDGLQAAAGSETAFLQRIGIVASIAVYTALTVAVVAAARLRAGRRWRELLALRAWHPFRGSRLFWLLALATMAYSLAADAIVSRLYPPAKDWVSLPHGSVWGMMFVLLAVVFAPVAEEFFFRGWIYTALRALIGAWPGILVTSALFALAHWENTHLYALAVFPVGVVLGLVRERTQSLTASMTFHALYNAGASIVLLAGR